MDNILIYALQVNLFLAIVYAGYGLLLKNLTFYQMNRSYFLLGILFAFAYPFLDLKALFKSAEPIGEVVQFLPLVMEQQFEERQYPLSLSSLLLFIVFAGVLVFTLKLAVQLLSLRHIHLRSRPAKWRSFWYRNVFFPVAPFSFFNTIYLHREQHAEGELADIFKHEDIHVRGRHTFDILFVEFAFILCWYNPVIWLMRKAVRQNLEFLTDQQILDRGADRELYQYSLLNVSRQGLHTPVANQFNFNILKKRIMMMNKRRSSRLELSKYVFLIPVFVFAAGAFTVSRAERNIGDVVQKAEDTSLDVILPKKRSAMRNSADTVRELRDTVRKPIVVIGYGSRDSTLEKREPIIVGSGKASAGAFQLGNIPADEIERIDVIKDTSEFGKDRIMITMKRKPDTVGVKRFEIVGIKGAQPIYVLDGKKIDSIEVRKINPNDIESIHVLKGNAGTDIYGDEGKNGVVQIKMKKKGEVSAATTHSHASVSGVLSKAEVLPEPPGGMVAFRKWIADHYSFPQEAIDAGVKGTVEVAFIVEKDGSLSDFRVLQDLGHGTGEAAVALLKKSAKWSPALENGRPVRMNYTLPIRLDLSPE